MPDKNFALEDGMQRRQSSSSGIQKHGVHKNLLRGHHLPRPLLHLPLRLRRHHPDQPPAAHRRRPRRHPRRRPQRFDRHGQSLSRPQHGASGGGRHGGLHGEHRRLCQRAQGLARGDGPHGRRQERGVPDEQRADVGERGAHRRRHVHGRVRRPRHGRRGQEHGEEPRGEGGAADEQRPGPPQRPGVIHFPTLMPLKMAMVFLAGACING